MPKRRKRSVPWAPILWIAVLANVIAGVYFSPITALRTVRAEGVDASGQSYVRTVMGKLKGQPAMQISPASVESKMLLTSSVSKATFQRNIFGRGTLHLTYREPVARISGKQGLFLSADGAIFRSARAYEGLPELRLYANALKPNLSLAGMAPVGRLGWLFANLPKAFSAESAIVEIEAGGAVSLTDRKSGFVVRLGAPNEFEKKLRRFDEIISDRPNLFQEIRALNLTSPDRAAYVP
jgi:cell division septal protein FtsQ